MSNRCAATYNVARFVSASNMPGVRLVSWLVVRLLRGCHDAGLAVSAVHGSSRTLPPRDGACAAYRMVRLVSLSNTPAGSVASMLMFSRL